MQTLRVTASAARPATPPPTTRRAALLSAAAATVAAANILLAAPVTAAAIPDPGCALQTAASGVQWCDTKEGTGPPANPAAPVRAHYTGRLASTGVVFDSSFERGRPLTFSKNQVIKGWGLGVFGDGGDGAAALPPMKEGGVRRLVIPSDLGYGERGAGGVIPPSAALVFDVTLLGPRTR